MGRLDDITLEELYDLKDISRRWKSTFNED
jgi:hypothetical protein